MSEPIALDLSDLVFHSARTGDVDTLRRSLVAGFPANAVNPRGDSLLMVAAYHDRLGCVTALLEHGADPNIRDNQGQAPLSGVAFKGFVEVATALLDGGAFPNAAANDGRTPLMVAAAFNRSELVQLLLARGAKRELRDDAGVCAHDIAVSMGAPDAARLLTQDHS